MNISTLVMLVMKLALLVDALTVCAQQECTLRTRTAIQHSTTSEMS